MPKPQPISREALDRFEQFTATPILGWVLCNYRGWAWLRCRDCGWWLVSPDEDLLPAWEKHLVDRFHPS